MSALRSLASSRSLSTCLTIYYSFYIFCVWLKGFILQPAIIWFVTIKGENLQKILRIQQREISNASTCQKEEMIKMFYSENCLTPPERYPYSFVKNNKCDANMVPKSSLQYSDRCLLMVCSSQSPNSLHTW